MKWELSDIELEEVSCVDIGANQHADIVLFKRDVYDADVKALSEGAHGRNADVTIEELATEVEALTKRIETLTAERDAAAAQAEALRKAADAAGFDFIDGNFVKRAEPEYIEIDGERIAKSAIPAPVLARLEKQAAEIEKARREAHEAALAKRGAEELPNLAGTPLAKGRLLEAIGNDEQLLKALKAADAAMAGAYVEKGRADQHEMLTPEQELDKLAKAHADAKGMSYELAYAAVLETEHGRSLLTKLRGHSN